MTAALVGVHVHCGCEAASSASFEMMFVDLERLDLRFQSSRRNPQLHCRSRRSGHASLGFGQSGLDHLSFLEAWASSRASDSLREVRTRPGEPTLVDEKISVSQRMTDRSITFCNSRMLPGQGYALHQLQGLLVDALYLFSRLPRKSVDEVLDQHRYVLFPFPQRRNFDRKDIEPIKQIASKNAGSNRRLQVAIGGGNHPNVSSNCSIPADTFKFVLLQNSQQRDLRFWLEVRRLHPGRSCRLPPVQTGPGAAVGLR